MKKEPLVSIVMPLYNCENYVAEAVESVISQSYRNWELIIVDDASTDNSYLIVKKLVGNNPKVKIYHKEQNIGVAKARNYALQLSEGKYIAFLDSDDIWLPNKLEIQIGFMEVENIFLSYTSYYIINKKSKITSVFLAEKTVTYDDMLKTSQIGTLTTIYNAEKLGKYYFQEIGHEDYVMKLQILKGIDCARGIEEPLAKYRISDNSLSKNKIKTALWQWKIYRNIEKLSLGKSFYYFIHYIYNGLKKYS